jgi:hypothetical protein
MVKLGAMDGEKLEAAIRAAEALPLGSDKNPVRVNMPVGEQAYLRRLRCEDGNAPGFDRGGSVGRGPFGFIVDVYNVTCPGKAAVEVYMDMYHERRENRPVPGFTIAE